MTTRRTFLAAGAAAFATALAAPAIGQTRAGTFAGASGHVTRGTARLVERNGRYTIELGEDFFFDGAPDPKVGLGANGYDPRTNLGPLQSDTGAQSYAVPRNIRAGAYNEIWIWCERFNVPLGVARL
ncbi:MAG: DM13 domain-containing protein [Pseudomonadota bacterium]